MTASTREEEGGADCIRSEQASEHVLLIRFDRYAKRNALTNAMVLEIARLLKEAKADPQVRCVVFTGNDTVFSAGADLNNMRKHGVFNVVNDPLRVDAWNTLQTFPKPMIAAVNGIAFGAGNELAMCCDFVIAGRNAQFGQPEAKTAGMAGDGGTQRLPRKFGPNLAAYMLFTGDPVDAETAFRVGYAIELCDPDKTLSRALSIASVISSRGPLAVQAMKACIHTAVGATFENGLAVERVKTILNMSAADRLEGLAAFTEKREPRFSGK
jgi:enoyl-CoA hydratase/carnithine racemase